MFHPFLGKSAREQYWEDVFPGASVNEKNERNKTKIYTLPTMLIYLLFLNTYWQINFEFD